MENRNTLLHPSFLVVLLRSKSKRSSVCRVFILQAWYNVWYLTTDLQLRTTYIFPLKLVF